MMFSVSASDLCRLRPCLFFFLAVMTPCGVGQPARGVPVDKEWPFPEYRYDDTWPQNKSQIDGKPFSVGVSPDGLVYVLQRGGSSPILKFDADSGELVGKWSNVAPTPNEHLDTPHGLRLMLYGDSYSVWITDVGNTTGHVLRRYSADGDLLDVLGTPGKAGSSTDPLQFGNVAELAFIPPGGDDQFSEIFYVVDGDGGPNNRLLGMQGLPNGSDVFNVNWSVGSRGTASDQFNIPHDVDFDSNSRRIVVADRANARLQLLDTSGEFLEQLTCMQPSQPYGVRVLPESTGDVMYLATTHVQEHHVMLLRHDRRTKVEGNCTVLSTLVFGTESSPHLLDVDMKSGIIFVADITAQTVYKLVPTH